MYSQALIFIAFGIGLNPRQGKVIGPAFAPLLIGAVLAIGNLCSNLARPGYTGMCTFIVQFNSRLRRTDVFHTSIQSGAMSWSDGCQKRDAVSLRSLVSSVSGCYLEWYFLSSCSSVGLGEAPLRGLGIEACLVV